MAVKKIFFDIETVPAIDDKHAQKMYADHVERFGDGSDFNAFLKNAAINGAFARVITIGYAIDDSPVKVLGIDPDANPFGMGDSDSDAEYDLLERFAEVVKPTGSMRKGVLVGWNINIFDLKILWQRAMIVGSRLRELVPSPSVPPWKMSDTIDLAAIWNGNSYKNRATQYDLALAAGVIPEFFVFGDDERGIPPSGNGGQIFEWVREGGPQGWGRVMYHQTIDIIVTRALYRLLVMRERWQDVRAKSLREWDETVGKKWH